jgi:uncharacterized protein (TIGR03118 family)
MTLCGLPGSGRVAAARDEGGQDTQSVQIPAIPAGSAYRQTNLVSDVPGMALVQDPLLVNPWGISMTATSPFWTSNAGTGTSSLYRGDVGGAPLFKQAGMPSIVIPGGLPTGTVANATTDFVLPGSCAAASCPARFIFASITGNIVGWNPNAPAAGSTTGVIAAHPPDSPAPHVYTGLAIGVSAIGNTLYAADFANGRIDVFDKNYVLQSSGFPFVDPTIPTSPASNTYHPFNIQNIGGTLYVAYAKVDPVTRLDQEGVGNGYVSKFDTNGAFLGRVVSNGPLNSPWGLAIAPATFGTFGGTLLVGNFGEGGPSINAFNPTTGAHLGSLKNEAGVAIEIDELWALTFGNGGAGGDANALYFTAGPGEEEHGLFGSLRPTTATATSLVQLSSDGYEIGEGGGSIQITVTRSGNVSELATVNYNTMDESTAGHATQKKDYEIAVGTVRFAPGETSKTFRIPLVDDRFVEGAETVEIVLSNPTGAGVGLGSPNTAELTITDNDAAPTTANPIDTPGFFVRQHYLDFLNREPDAPGFAAWLATLSGCAPGNTACDRVAVSSAFFRSAEFQSRGYFATRFYRAAFGRNPLFGEFMGDLSRLGGTTASETAALNALFPAEFAQRPEFRATLDSLTNTQYVDRLISNTGVTFPASTRDQWIADLNSSAKTRAQVLREVVESPQFVNDQSTFNRAFVLAEYFGYLRRDPEPGGFQNWLNFLNANPSDFRTMVNGFVNSTEYRARFGTP